MNDALTTYKKAQCDGASQRDLIVMCYKGTLKYLSDARGKFEAGDNEAFSDLLEKAHRVIFHLYTTLNMEQGGEIAAGLGQLYAFIISQIYLIDATKKLDLLDGVVEVLTTLKGGWEGIDPAALTMSEQQMQNQAKTSRKILSVEV